MSGSLETFSRHILNVLQAQQSQILQALNVHSYDIHQKLSAIQGDVESLRNETLSQQNAFRSAFDIVAARLDDIQQISQTPRPAPPAIMPPPNKGAIEDHRMLLEAINTRMEATEGRLGKSMGDVAKKVLAVEHNVAKIFETVKDPRASCELDRPNTEFYADMFVR
jgi:TolA-binding protein